MEAFDVIRDILSYAAGFYLAFDNTQNGQLTAIGWLGVVLIITNFVANVT